MAELKTRPTGESVDAYMDGFDEYHGLLDKLGKHRIGKWCL